MRKDFFTGIVATALAMGLYYYFDHSEAMPQKTDSEQIENSLEKIQEESASVSASSADSTLVKPMGTSAGEPAKPEENQIVYKQFSEHLKTIGTCLEIKNSVDSDKIDPTFDNLVVSLRPALGEVVVQMDDWNQRDLKNSLGERKRLRTEVSYQDAGISSPTKRVQLYKLNEQGMPELQTIDPEQSVNPSDAFVESLIGTDFQTSIEEKGGRAYYQEGEELVMIERNGKLESISLTKGGKTVSCSGLDSLSSICQCL